MKINAKQFKQQLEGSFHGYQLAANRFRERPWYRTHYLVFLAQSFLQNSATPMKGLPQSTYQPFFVDMLSQFSLTNDKLALMYLFSEYNEALTRWKVQPGTAFRVQLQSPPFLGSISTLKGLIEVIRVRDLLPTVKRSVFAITENLEQAEELRLDNGVLNCTCSFTQEYGGLPCRHKLRVAIEGKLTDPAKLLLEELSEAWIV